MQCFVGVSKNKRDIGLLLRIVGVCLALTIGEAWAEEEALLTKLNINIDGARGSLEKNIIARLPAYRPPCWADLETMGKFQRALQNKLKRAERALGYYQSSNRITFINDETCWKVTAKIVPGPPVRIKKQRIEIVGEGRQDEQLMAVFQKSPYQKNDILNHKIYTDYKNNLLEMAQQRGYLDARFQTKQIILDLQNNSAEINMTFVTGKRFRYGNISVAQKILEDKYLRRFVVIKEGEYFSSAEMIRQQQLLQNSGYYAMVSVAAKYEAAKQQAIPIVITLKERKRNGYKLRLGYGTDTGLRSKASMERRWTGSSGRRLNIEVGLSQRINELKTQLTVPKDDPDRNNLFYTASYKQENNDDVESENFRVGIVSTSLRDSDWKRTLSLSYLDDRTTVLGESATKSRLTLAGVKYSKVKADKVLFPDDGWRIRFEAEGALDKVLSDASVFSVSLHGKKVKKIGEGRLITRIELGKTFGDELDDLPKDLRFFAGGINSVRGFNYESLGEVNDDGNVIGGRNLLETSLEYEHPIQDKWSAAIFADTGNAFDQTQDTTLKLGVGAGIRWRSPIGAVRVDFAVPHDDTSDLHLHLSIGPDL
ncbi:MAG: Outer membrane protein assembly factor YaeT precursor [uncultured Thiotrichaceae bacterium]|uniref:Translocation and assembly module subunit TamA n=1 Tax=uncultured Thiotrichaceae bacterium TaxID=298394 RepID=A0A6S6TXQ9_9GAMM|nr:MAG: Outer membrane protein assembly factor YaeT precursor [uncultured Thiotrichaceae bacterium]